jgi:tartrate dehydratase alpha subunit/fumarate hydratase class I-like protein
VNVNWPEDGFKKPKFVALIRNDQQYAHPLFYVLAPTRFGSSLPSSGSFLEPSELREIQYEWVVYHIIMCGYVACVPDCCGVVRCASQLSAVHIVGHL